MSFGLLSNATQRVEFVTMKGPQGKGHAEMAVTKPKGKVQVFIKLKYFMEIYACILAVTWAL